jgi:hypothetical protein
VNGRLCQSVVNRTPVGGENNSGFEIKGNTVFLWTQVKDGSVTNIDHVWSYASVVQWTVPLTLIAPQFRSHSSKIIPADALGSWKVEVFAGKKLLHTYNFKVARTEDGLWAEPHSSNNTSGVTQEAKPVPPPAPVIRKSTDGAVTPLPEQAVPERITVEPKSRRVTDGPITPLPPPPEPPKDESKPKVLEKKPVNFVRGFFAREGRTNFVNLGFGWSPHYRFGVFGLRGNLGVEEQKGRAAGNAEILWIWILNGQNEFEIGGGLQNWNGTSSPMFSGNFVIKSDMWFGLHVNEIYAGYSKVNVPGENRQSIRIGLGFEF